METFNYIYFHFANKRLENWKIYQLYTFSTYIFVKDYLLSNDNDTIFQTVSVAKAHHFIHGAAKIELKSLVVKVSIVKL